MQVETVKIVDKNKRGFKTINKSDYDAKLHKTYGVATKPAPLKKPVKKKVKNADSK